MLSLPEDILGLICVQLDSFGLRNLLISCKYLANKIKSEKFWTRLINQLDPSIDLTFEYCHRRMYLSKKITKKLQIHFKDPAINIGKIVVNRCKVAKILVSSPDFDLFLLGTVLFQMILIPKKDLDLRDNFECLFKFIPKNILTYYLQRTKLSDILKICRKEETSNIDLFKIAIIGHDFISCSEWSNLLIKSWKYNDLEITNYIWTKLRNVDNFKYILAIKCVKKDIEEIFYLVLNELNILEFLRRYGTTLTQKFYEIIFEEYPKIFISYFEDLCRYKRRAAYKIYKNFDNIEIKLIYLDYLLSIPINRFRTFEDEMVRKIIELVSFLETPEHYKILQEISYKYKKISVL